MLSSIRKINIIAKYTFKEIIQSKILFNTLFIGCIMFLVTFVAYNFTYGEPSRIALDFGLGTLSLSSVGIAIFIGSGLLSKEITNRTVYMIISRPVSRASFLIGKLIGLASILLLNILLLSFITLSLYFVTGGEFQAAILWCIAFTMLESLIILALVCLFSLVTTQTLAVLFTMMTYVAGHSIDGVKLLTFVENRPFLSMILELYHYLLPGFYKFNIKENILYDKAISLNYLFSMSCYGLFYISFLVFLSIWLFERKNLD